MLGSSNCVYNSLLYLILHVLFSFTRPSIIPSTYISTASRADSDVLARLQLSYRRLIQPYLCLTMYLMMGSSEQYTLFA
jgi:hypothetical protein